MLMCCHCQGVSFCRCAWMCAHEASDCCRHACRTELAQAPIADRLPNTETVQRPVIRWNKHWVFTRIEPERVETSMVMMLRPGWPEYWSSLTGLPWPELAKGANNEGDRSALL